jgi:hypothetical protein
MGFGQFGWQLERTLPTYVCRGSPWSGPDESRASFLVFSFPHLRCCHLSDRYLSHSFVFTIPFQISPDTHYYLDYLPVPRAFLPHNPFSAILISIRHAIRHDMTSPPPPTPSSGLPSIGSTGYSLGETSDGRQEGVRANSGSRPSSARMFRCFERGCTTTYHQISWLL